MDFRIAAKPSKWKKGSVEAVGAGGPKSARACVYCPSLNLDSATAILTTAILTLTEAHAKVESALAYPRKTFPQLPVHGWFFASSPIGLGAISPRRRLIVWL
jgi:hypothetical protein